MKQNMGTIDRLVRTLLAVLIVVLYFTGQITGTAAILLGIVAILFLATSFMGFCPAYLPLKITTKKSE
ncbi:MAG: YgaP family membrane protein [Spirochaetota bacterium]